MALITASDYEVRTAQTLDAEETAQVEALLDDASALVQLAAPCVDLETLDPLPPAIVPVLVSMARRAVENPRGLTGEQLGDYSWQAQGGQSSASVYMTRNEKRIVRRAAGCSGVTTKTLEGHFPPLAESAQRDLSDNLLEEF